MKDKSTLSTLYQSFFPEDPQTHRQASRDRGRFLFSLSPKCILGISFRNEKQSGFVMKYRRRTGSLNTPQNLSGLHSDGHATERRPRTTPHSTKRPTIRNSETPLHK